MTEELKSALAAWLKDRPAQIQELAWRYPPGTRFKLHDKIVYVVAYGEEKSGDAGLMISEINPSDDYAQAVATRHSICSCCVRKIDQFRI